MPFPRTLQRAARPIGSSGRRSVGGVAFCLLALVLPLLLTACDKPYFDRDRGVFVFHRPGK